MDQPSSPQDQANDLPHLGLVGFEMYTEAPKHLMITSLRSYTQDELALVTPNAHGEPAALGKSNKSYEVMVENTNDC